jgi:hypothetical protein
MIYVASPYGHADPTVVQGRMEQVYAVMAIYMRHGIHCVTPLSMHEICIRHDLDGSFAFWEKYCFDILKRCDSMLVLKSEGWEVSRGVQAEIKFCEEHNIPVEYL